MGSQDRPKIGFTCSYTPLPLIHAAGFEPHRILPLSDAPDQAGSLLHDNLCPHIKRILDRALADDLPELAGVVLMNSCDAMRRLSDAWGRARPDDRLVLVDLPVSVDERQTAFLVKRLEHLASVLAGWSRRPVDGQAIVDSVGHYNELADGLQELARRAPTKPGGPAAFQHLCNRSVTTSLTQAMEEVRRALADEQGDQQGQGVPILLFGNVLPDPEAMDLFSASGCRVVVDDLCTGSRQITRLQVDDPERAIEQLARAVLARPVCARTFQPEDPGSLAQQVVDQAKEVGAEGVVAHVMKFCDPYLARLPGVRQALRAEGLPFLVLEGDCSLRSLGQQRTRIQAFVEMIGG